MKTKANEKRRVKSDVQDNGSLSGQGSGHAKNATKATVKEEIAAEVSMAVEVHTASKSNRECKQSVMKRKRSTSVCDSSMAQRKVDSEMVHDALPSRKRKAAVLSSWHDEPFQQEKHVHQSVDKRRLSREKQHPTRTRKPTSKVQKKTADKEQLESAIVSDVKNSAKVKRELPSPVSAIKAVDKMSVKTEKPDVACTSTRHSCRKFVGSHFSIVGMYSYIVVFLVTVLQLFQLSYVEHCASQVCVFLPYDCICAMHGLAVEILFICLSVKCTDYDKMKLLSISISKPYDKARFLVS